MEQKTITNILIEKAKTQGHDIFHWSIDERGDWSSIALSSFFQRVLTLSHQLRKSGLLKGDVVGIMVSAGPRWEELHHAILLLGGVVVGLEKNEPPHNILEMARLANIQFMILDNSETLEQFPEELRTQLSKIYLLEKNSDDAEDLIHLDPSLSAPSDEREPFINLASPEDFATIIFTSGTTGKPKAIAYKHKQVVAAIESITENFIELKMPGCRLVSWLPLANLFQRIINLCALANGAQVYFVDNPQKIIQTLPFIQPHIFVGVPRFYEKLYQAFDTQLNKAHFIIRPLLKALLSIGEREDQWGLMGRRINAQFFKKFKNLFGRNILYFVSGSAPMPLWLLKRYHSLGFLILEAYGLSENVVPMAANRRSNYRFGTVGKPMMGNEIRFAEDSEVLVKGLGVFNGYLGQVDSDDTFTPDGFFATGDCAQMDSEGFIRLNGRKSEAIKTSTGRKIAPVSVEEILKKHSDIEHIVVFGEGRSYLAALVMTRLGSLTGEKTLKDLALEIAQGMRGDLLELTEYKRPSGMVVCSRNLSFDQQELTANLKLRRKAIYEAYQNYFSHLYSAIDDRNSPLHQGPLVVDSDVVLVKL